MRSICATLLFLYLATAMPAYADPFLDGGEAYEAGDNVRALDIWKPVAEAGDPRAQFAIANMYFEGLGVKKNQATAAYWMERAAQQGLSMAQLLLGNNYREGYGLTRDDTEAVEWWQLAAEQGVTDAMYNLGVHYYYGRGVRKDGVTAFEWFLKAADGGHKLAQTVIRTEPIENAAEQPAGDAKSSPALALAATTPNPELVPEQAVEPGIRTTEWIMDQNPEDYTIQLAAMSDQEGVERYLRKHGIEGKIGVYPRKMAVATVLVIILGVFPDKDSARQVLAQLPAVIRKQRIWARSFAEIQAIVTEQD